MCAAYMSTYLITIVIVVLFGYSDGVLQLVETHCFLLSTQPITNLLKNTNLKITFFTTNTIYMGLIYYALNKKKKINTFRGVFTVLNVSPAMSHTLNKPEEI